MESAQVLRALAGDEDLTEDAPDRKHLLAAQAAIAAYCQGDDAAMHEALQAIPFRSPYRDLRFLLGALTAFPERIEEGKRWLARIGPDSPLAPVAEAVDAIFAGDRRALRPAAREFADAILGPKLSLPELFAALLAQVQGPHAPVVQEALKALLVDYPEGKAAYRERFPLPAVEEQRLAALAAERAEDFKTAFKLWGEVGCGYEQAGKRLEAAVARHRAALAAKLFGPQAAEVEKMLQRAVRLDPDHRESWLELAEWYQRLGNLKALSKLLKGALSRFPDDPAVLEMAATVALARGACQYAARLTAKHLTLDPRDRAARQRLFAATLSLARKQIASGRLQLAAKELGKAAEWVSTAKEQAKLNALEVVLALRRGEPEPHFPSLLPAPLGEFWLTAEVLCLAPERAKPYLSRLREVFKVAALSVYPDHLIGVLDLAQEAVSSGAPKEPLLKAARPLLRRGVFLKWREEELEAVCERLLALEQYQWVRDYARGPLWRRKLPALYYFDVVAKCQGAAAALGWRDWLVLEQALGAAQAGGRHRLAARIAEFLAGYDRALSG
ncbi:hypothetical protein JCM13664_19200 [Methylothermus subterraneus]